MVAVVSLLGGLSCNASRAEPAPAPASFDLAAHERRLAEIESSRVALDRRFAAATDRERDAIRARARRAVVAAITDDIFPAWMGTPWGLGRNSTSRRPHQPGMTVGCSYFVTSVLESAGLRLDDRYRFARAPALDIQRSLAPARADLHRFLSIPAAALRDRIAALGDGLYLIGLDCHIGFVVVAGGEVSLVHASYTEPRAVRAEPLAGARAIAASREAGYFVTPLFADAGDFLIDRWLTGDPVRFAGR